MSKMMQVKLKNKVEMPILGLGTHLLTGEACRQTVKTAIELGYTSFDTAEYYSNHLEIGEAIKDLDRSKLFITSKVWADQLKYDDVLKAFDKATRELGTNYLDLYLIHWPNKNIPLKETFEAFRKLYDGKKIRAIGVSNFTINLLEAAMLVSKIPICVNQVEFHPFLFQNALLEFCNKHDIKIVAYSPVARGLVLSNSVLSEIAFKHNKTSVQVSLRWLIEKKIVAIPKASTREHLRENIDIFDFKLNKEEIAQIDSLPQRRLMNPGFVNFNE
jgi:2,5-diketo-D-gluconate reductase B